VVTEDKKWIYNKKQQELLGELELLAMLLGKGPHYIKFYKIWELHMNKLNSKG